MNYVPVRSASGVAPAIASSAGGKGVARDAFDLLFRADQATPPLYQEERGSNNLMLLLPRCMTPDGRIDLQKLYANWEAITGDEDMTEAAFDALFGNQNNELDGSDVITGQQFIARLAKARGEFAIRGDFMRFRQSSNVTITGDKAVAARIDIRQRLRDLDRAATAGKLPAYHAELKRKWETAKKYVGEHAAAFGISRENRAEKERIASEMLAGMLVAQFRTALEAQEKEAGVFSDFSIKDVDFKRKDVSERFAAMVVNYHFGDPSKDIPVHTLPTEEQLSALRSGSITDLPADPLLSAGPGMLFTPRF